MAPESSQSDRNVQRGREAAGGEAGARAGTQGSAGGRREASQELQPRGRGDLQHYDLNPFSSLMQISREMDRLMDAFFGGSFGGLGRMPAPRFAEGSAFWPQIELRQGADSIVLHVDLPGVRPEDVQIEATDEGLAISGERVQQREQGGRDQSVRRTERVYGSFYRQIPLPEGARFDAAQARMENGVLEITVPLESRRERRRIEIQRGAGNEPSGSAAGSERASAQTRMDEQATPTSGRTTQ